MLIKLTIGMYRVNVILRMFCANVGIHSTIIFIVFLAVVHFK